MKKIALPVILYFCFSLLYIVEGMGQAIYSYTNATTGAANSVAINATGTSLSRVNGAGTGACGTGFSSTTFSSTTTFSTSLAAVEVTITPNSGFQLNVTSFSAGLRRSNTGPTTVRYAYSTDGGITWTNQGLNQSPNNGSCGATATGTWTTSVVTTNALKFRIYGFNASSAAGVLQLLNLSINGTLTAVSSCIPPATQASGLSFTGVTSSDLTLSWLNAGADLTLVTARLASTGLVDPLSGTTYTANSVFGSGSTTGTGNFVVYNGTGTSVNVTGLSSCVSYIFDVYFYNASGTCYKTPGATASQQVLPGGGINTFPYTEDFNSTNGGWTSGGNSDTWVWGTINKTIMQPQSTGDKSWTVTSLTGDYSPGFDAYIESPTYNLSSLSYPQLSFRMWYEAETSFDGTNLQYSTDNGTTWTVLGSTGEATTCLTSKWYNANPISHLNGGQAGWTGNGASGTGGWITAQRCLPLSGEGCVKFRFYFGAGTINQYNGVEIDDFTIQETDITTDYTFGCTGNSLAFSSAVTPCAVTYAWDFGDPLSGSNTSTAANPTHNFTSAGIFTVQLTSTTPCGKSATKSKQVTVSTCSSVPLPVTLTSFTATHISSGAFLQWDSGLETNFLHYEIQSSADGINFKTIGIVDGHGKSSEYNFTDYDFKSATYYRLIMVDKDNSFHYSPVVFLQNSETGRPYSVAPNPATEYIKISFSDKENSSVKLINVTGVELFFQETSEENIVIDLRNFSSGLYFLQVEKNGKLYLEKILKN